MQFNNRLISALSLAAFLGTTLSAPITASAGGHAYSPQVSVNLHFGPHHRHHWRHWHHRHRYWSRRYHRWYYR